MFKHIGKHGDRKVVILFRTVPNEDHMCLVMYPETVNSMFQSNIQRVLESAPGQQADEFADALSRNLFDDGTQMLQRLHKEGMIKKVRTQDILVTPDNKSKVRLDELNRIMTSLKEGGEAAAELARLDSSSGFASPEEIQRVARERAEALHQETTADIFAQAQQQTGGETPPPPSDVVVPPMEHSLFAGDNEALTDQQLARNSLQQAEAMMAQAQVMLNEAERMKDDAYGLDPDLAPKRGRGRPRGAKNK